MGRDEKGEDSQAGSASRGREPERDPAWVGLIRDSLLDWYGRHGRHDLPWRSDRDPYRVLVSEVMLVQTTVAAAGPYYARFLARFPTPEALALAEEEDVLKAWEGLGYYRRARQLQEAARVIVREHGGTVPCDPEALRRLPGVGRYIAGAVASIAFDRPEPILEANSQRVLARWLAWPLEVNLSASQARLWEAAGRLVPPEGAGRFNQALMDLGATICTPKTPLCLACPVAEACEARRLGQQDDLPRRTRPTPPLEVAEATALAVDERGRFLVVRRAPGRLWEHFTEFPTVHLSGADPAGRGPGDPRLAPEALEPRFEALTGVRLRLGPIVQTIRYAVTKHRVSLTAFSATPVGGSPSPGQGLSKVEWLTLDELDSMARSAATRRLSRWAAGSMGPGGLLNDEP